MRRSILAAFVASLLLPSVLLAHGGGLDRHGCHNETATGGYHCHRSSSTSDSSKKDDGPNWGIIAGVGGGLLILWLVVDLFKDDENTKRSFQIAPTVIGDSEAEVTADYLLRNGQRIGIRASNQIEDGRDESIVGLHWKVEF